MSLDFVKPVVVTKRNGMPEIQPQYRVGPSKDLMIRGGDFYAIWNEETNLWSTDESVAITLIDKMLYDFYESNKDVIGHADVQYLSNAMTKQIDIFHHYVQKQCRDNYHPLDSEILFQNSEINKSSYATHTLPYAIAPGDTTNWDALVDVLYNPEEKMKIEWSIGAIISGDSKNIQKFCVFYGDPGTGKSTILNVIQLLFDGYWAVFDAKALTAKDSQFALEAFRTNPLVAIQHDGDLSRIIDNTKLNSLVSHEVMTVNEKYKAAYPMRINSFLYMGTNEEVRISDMKSGIIRRLIDIRPTGRIHSYDDYLHYTSQIPFELGAIAYKCLQVYTSNKKFYNSYVPDMMIADTNELYNFVADNYFVFAKQDYTTLKTAFEMYKLWCDETGVIYKLTRLEFKTQLKSYFNEYEENSIIAGKHTRCVYRGFRRERFDIETPAVKPGPVVEKTKVGRWLEFNEKVSLLDTECAECPAQLANDDGVPRYGWDQIKTRLCDIDTSKLHYVRLPLNHIVIDFDIRNASGEKDLLLNIEEASKFPPTYAEISKGGNGVHLHYFYDGDPTLLSCVYDGGIEIKVFTGKASLRRKLSRCNALPIATISSGLPLKEVRATVNDIQLKNERQLRALIERCLNKESHPDTNSNVNFICKLVDDAYTSGMVYDINDLRQRILIFASNSTNHASECVAKVGKLHYESEKEPDYVEASGGNGELAFVDCEVFPNLFVVCWKFRGDDKSVVKMINPSAEDIQRLFQLKLVGFNNLDYDNLILYAAAYWGYTPYQLFLYSQQIISAESANRVHNKFAQQLSYTDIYDFANGDHKKSLKKWEIALHIHHKECPYAWDQPVPEDKWGEVADYCANDVIATEKTFDALEHSDFKTRMILSTIADMTPNTKTNRITAKLMFGDDPKPQVQFRWRDLSQPVDYLPPDVIEFYKERTSLPLKFDSPVPGYETSLLPFFPDYKYENGVSTYRGEVVGEGGYVYAEPGYYENVALLDIASMHPTSAVCECFFGPNYTRNFDNLKRTRICIKHGDLETPKSFFDGRLAPFLTDPNEAEALSTSLKIPINMVYGVTAAKYDNKFRDPRNKDNIIAKRGALFMIDLKNEVQKRGFTVAHIKTDSIKIPNATPEIIQFVMDFGRYYGYEFEHEATYERMCLVNDAVYIAWVASGKHANTWSPTGKQFAVPYVYKTLFSHEDLDFYDLCETFSVQKGALFMDCNEGYPDVTDAEKRVAKLTAAKRKALREGGPIPLDDELLTAEQEVAKGHNYVFVGRVGLFTPVIDGVGGAHLYRKRPEGGYSSVANGVDYRWLEAETVLALDLQSKIDYSYFDKLAADAVAAIEEYIPFEQFIQHN